MSTKTLVIDGSDTKHFALTVNDGLLQVGDTQTHPEGIARGLRVLRIRCEVEIEEGRDNLPIDQPGVLGGGALGPAGLRLPHAQLVLRDTPDVLAASPPASDAGLFSLDLDLAGPGAAVDAPAPPPPPADDAGLLSLDLDLAGPGAADALAPPAAAPAPPAPRRFKVVDGGDQGRSFRLPDTGTVTLGKRGHATIGLNDLYVMRVHCSLEIDAHAILVTHVEGQNGTLIDTQRIAGPTRLRPGNVLRVGNSHLKLEVGPFADEAPAAAADPWLGEERPRVRMPHGPTAEVPPGGTNGVGRVPESGEEPAESDDGAATRTEPQGPGAADVELVEDDPLDALKGQTLGHYEVGELLGRGLSGAVYQAADPKTGQAVALKVFPAGFPASAAELERVVREFKAVQQLRHPNLVTPLGAGKSGGHFWISRELVEGESAAGLIAAIAGGEKPSWTRAARVAIHLARLLDWLHPQGVVHGNITPPNVLLRGADRTVMLADLRLTQALEGSQLQQSLRGKKLLADLPYLAPEQAEPGARADTLADLYAVGAVVYALLTGRPPAAGATPKEVRKGRPPRPSSVYSKVPPEFDGTVMRLLARYREDRFPTAAALLADLELLARSHDLKM